MSDKFAVPHFSAYVNGMNMKVHPVVALYKLIASLQREFQMCKSAALMMSWLCKFELLSVKSSKKYRVLGQKLAKSGDFEKSRNFWKYMIFKSDRKM